jgi:hypothetical protein
MRTLTTRTPATTNIGFEPRGYLHISGEFANTHRSDIETVLRGEEQRAHRDSPTARIVGWDDDGSGGLLVTTSTEHLAHRLGRSLEKGLGGEVHHGFSYNNKLALVWWRCRATAADVSHSTAA